MDKSYCKCGGAKGYSVVNGKLTCNICGGLSPRARLVNNEFIRIGDKPIVCPQCGYVLQEKMGEPLENKMAGSPENKQIWPPESRRAGRPRKQR